MRRVGILLFLAVWVMVVCITRIPTAQATLLVYEGFNQGNPGDSVADQGGGIGWSGNWTTSAGNPVIQWGSLDLPAGVPAATANSAKMTNATFNGDDVRRSLSATLNMDQDATYYYSFAMKVGTVDGQIALRDTAVANSYLEFGYYNWDDSFYIGAADGATPLCTVSSGDTMLVAGKLVATTTGPDRIYMNIYRSADTVPTSEPTSWLDYKTLWSNSFNFNNIAISGSNNAGIDEIRFGTSWSDVSVPEPCTSVMVGSGLLGLLAYAWRKRR